MAVPKKRVPIPEDAAEFWAWADKQTSLPASLVFVVKDYIARHGDGDAINAFSFDSMEKRGRKPRNSGEAEKEVTAKPPAAVSNARVTHDNISSTHGDVIDEIIADTHDVLARSQSVVQEKPVTPAMPPEPPKPAVVPAPAAPEPITASPTPTTSVSTAENPANSILAQMGVNSNSDEGNSSSDAEDMLASMMNI